jgi:hypothetical protein
MIQSCLGVCVCATSRNSVSKLRPCNDKCHAGDILNDRQLIIQRTRRNNARRNKSGKEEKRGGGKSGKGNHTN